MQVQRLLGDVRRQRTGTPIRRILHRLLLLFLFLLFGCVSAVEVGVLLLLSPAVCDIALMMKTPSTAKTVEDEEKSTARARST